MMRPDPMTILAAIGMIASAAAITLALWVQR